MLFLGVEPAVLTLCIGCCDAGFSSQVLKSHLDMKDAAAVGWAMLASLPVHLPAVVSFMFGKLTGQSFTEERSIALRLAGSFGLDRGDGQH